MKQHRHRFHSSTLLVVFVCLCVCCNGTLGHEYMNMYMWGISRQVCTCVRISEDNPGSCFSGATFFC